MSILPYAHVYERIGGLFNGIFSKVPIALCQGLDKIVARRVNKNAMGFGADIRGRRDLHADQLLQQVQPDI